MPRYSLVLLDLDGTLVDSAPDLCTALGLALAELGLPPHDLGAVRRMIGEGQRVLVERALGQAGADPARADELLPRFRAHYAAHLLDQTALYPGVAETIAALAAAVPLGVATNKPGAWARQIVTGLGLAVPHPLVLGEDDVGARKPDPLLLRELCRRAAVPAGETLFVGDSLIDLRTAAAAGMDMALCTWGYGDPATLALPAGPAPGRPRHRLQRFADLREIVLG